MIHNPKKEILSGIFWSLIGQFGYLAIMLISNFILARILSPAEFGQLGIVLFFISIAKVLTESGLGGALVRNNNASATDFSTIFIFNLFISTLLCLILIISSDKIANYYGDSSLKKILITSSLILIINAFQFVQSAKLIKNMRFKQKALYDFFSILFSALIGIILAINGYGVWSLVIMQILNSLTITILLWIFEGGFEVFKFELNSFKYYYKFGLNTTVASILSSVFENIYQVILVKFFAISQSGLFYQAKKLKELPFGVINQITQNVLFSSLSKIQNEENNFKETYQNVVRIFTVLIGFVSLVLFVFAKEFILILLGYKWIGATFFLQILILHNI